MSGNGGGGRSARVKGKNTRRLLQYSSLLLKFHDILGWRKRQQT